MRYQIMLLAALSLDYAIAQPAHHRHHHKTRRDMKDVDWKNIIDWTKVDYSAKPAVQKAPNVVDVVPIPAVSEQDDSNPVSKQEDSKPVSKQEDSEPDKGNSQSSSSSSGSGIVPGAKGGATGGHFGGRTTSKPGANKDVYMGNVGVPFGSNMMLVDTATAQEKNKYTITFKNNASEKKQIIVWQNPGRDGSPLGGKSEEPIITIPLAPGASQAVAFDEDIHGAFSLDCERNNYEGSTKCARGEFTFGDGAPKQWDRQEGSQGWSGFSRSVIMGGTDEMSMSCLNCGSGGPQLSAKGKNEFTSDKQTEEGGAIKPGPAHVLAEFA
ncbi:MAG: hypothetical protein Q9172_000785 [Xanthocarpia lactea]